MGDTTYGSSSEDVLCEHKSLGLNNKEVDELIQISRHAVQSLLWHCVISSWADLANDTSLEERLASKLSSRRHTERHPGNLEGVAEEIKITSTEDEHNNGGIGDGGGAWVLP